MNPLVLLGTVILVGTAAISVVIDAPLTAVLAQATLPIGLGIGLVAYGWYLDEDLTSGANRRIATWIGAGVLAFFVTGFWFGQISRLFDTSFLLAIYASLATGAAFGCSIGIYAALVDRTKAKLEAKNERMAEFANIVSHDLRSPLPVAKGRLHIADQALDADEPVDPEHFAAATDALDRMDDLVQNLLTLTVQGQLIDDPDPVELSTVTSECWAVVDTADATLAIDSEGKIYADPDRLRQVFENLFRDAVEHGGQDVRIHVGLTADGSGFFVEDDGPGIPPGERVVVFNSGYSSDSDGTGFGLAIVAEIAEAHGWQVDVGAGQDGGARFEFSDVTVEP
jgi:signal transduction histidine kinase